MKHLKFFAVVGTLFSLFAATPSFAQTASLNVGGIPTATCSFTSLTIDNGNLNVTCTTSVNYTGGSTPPAGGPYTLSATISPSASGTVTANSGTFTCGAASCSGTYASGSTVVLTATPIGGSTFAGWSGGGCTGTGTCTVTNMTTNVGVIATFTTTTTPPPSGVLVMTTPPICAANSHYDGSAGTIYAFPIPHTTSGSGQMALTLYPFSQSNFSIELSISKVPGDFATAKTMPLTKTGGFGGGSVVTFPYYAPPAGNESAGLTWVAVDAGRGIPVVPVAETWYMNVRFVPTTAYQGPWTVTVQVSTPTCS
jgi:hypothetical protein